MSAQPYGPIAAPISLGSLIPDSGQSAEGSDEKRQSTNPEIANTGAPLPGAAQPIPRSANGAEVKALGTEASDDLIEFLG